MNKNEKNLFYFCEGGNIAAVRFLTIKGVHINILDQDRTSPLHIACKDGSLQLVEEVLNQGANINMPDIFGWTPIHVACYYKRSEVVLLLLKHGANFEIKDREEIRPVDLAYHDQSCLDIINNFIVHKYNSTTEEKFKINIPENDFQLEEMSEETITNYRKIEIKNKNTNKLSEKIENENYFTFSNKNISNKKGIVNTGVPSFRPKSEKFIILSNSNRSFYIENKTIEDEKIKEDKNKILENYKIIPKKHKFYQIYNKYRNDRNSETINHSKENDNLSILKNKNNSYFKNHKTFFRNNTETNLPKISPFNTKYNHINAPKVFPNTNNLNNIKEYFTNSEVDGFNSEINLRHSYNFPKTFFKDKIIKNDTTNENFNSNNINFYSGTNTFYNIDIDSEKYKEYNSQQSSDNSDNSFIIDTSMTGDKVIMEMKENHKRNKSGVCFNKRKILNVESDHEEETVCMKCNDEVDDSAIFSEDVAHFNTKSISNIQRLISSKDNDSKIIKISKTDYFLTKIKISEIFLKLLHGNYNVLESIIISLFKIDSKFAVLFFLNVFDTNNNYEKLMYTLKKIIKNKHLILEILTYRINDNKEIIDLKNKFINKFLDSLDINSVNLNQILIKCLNCKEIIFINV